MKKNSQKTISVENLEKAMIKRSLKTLEKKRISQTDEKIISDTVQLIKFTHGFSCARSLEATLKTQQ